MNDTKLHYIYDPLCGWCYGAAPLVKAARELLPVQLHAGGMMAGAARRPVTADLRAFVMPHDRHIAKVTGQPFGAAYADGLLSDTSAVLDSGPPIAAVLAADALAGRGPDMLARLQTAHYVEGRRIADDDVLVQLATELGLEPVGFWQSLRALEGDGLNAHLTETRGLMRRLHAQGFPTFVIDRDGVCEVIDLGPFLGRPVQWSAWLRERAPVASASYPESYARQCNSGYCRLDD